MNNQIHGFTESDFNKYLTRQEVKEQFHLSYPTILKYEKLGILRGWRLGRRVLFERTELENALQRRDFQS